MSRVPLRGFTPKALTQARSAAGMTPADLARAADLATGETIRRWENTTSNPTIDLLAAVITVLRVDPTTLIRTRAADRTLVDWRNQRLLTRTGLARRAGMAVTLTGRLERGEADLTAERAERLAAALDISADQVRSAYRRARTRPAGTPA